MKKLLLINIILLLLCFGVCEYIACKKIKASFNPLHDDTSSLTYKITKKWDYKNKKDVFKTYFPKNMKGSILLFGCSYVEGGGIPEEEIFANVLSRDSNRIVYKRGRSNSATDFMYKQLMDENIMLEVPAAEYVIYVYLRYHGQRNFRYMAHPVPENDLRYVLKNGKLIEDKPFLTLPFYSLFLVKHFQDIWTNRQLEIDKKNGEPLLLKFLEKSYQKVQKFYPGAKFIFIEYPDGVYSLPPELQNGMDPNQRNLSQEIIKEIENIGFIYVNAEELVGHELRDLDLYRHTDKEHPNGRAWKEVSDALIKRFNL